ncbi:Arf GTPase arf1 [Balamuthia mandrillaris]
MGLDFSSLWGELVRGASAKVEKKKKVFTITMIGLDGAGKTTILYKLKKNEASVESVPTIGFNLELIQLSDNVNMSIIDVGGQDRLRDLWRHYYEGAHAIIFVIDSADSERFDDAKRELYGALEEESLKDAVLVVFANKQDLEQAATVLEVAERLGLRELTRLQQRRWYIQGTCAKSGDGLWSGMHWLVKELKYLLLPSSSLFVPL